MSLIRIWVSNYFLSNEYSFVPYHMVSCSIQSDTNTTNVATDNSSNSLSPSPPPPFFLSHQPALFYHTAWFPILTPKTEFVLSLRQNLWSWLLQRPSIPTRLLGKWWVGFPKLGLHALNPTTSPPTSSPHCCPALMKCLCWEPALPLSWTAFAIRDGHHFHEQEDVQSLSFRAANCQGFAFTVCTPWEKISPQTGSIKCAALISPEACPINAFFLLVKIFVELRTA